VCGGDAHREGRQSHGYRSSTDQSPEQQTFANRISWDQRYQLSHQVSALLTKARELGRLAKDIFVVTEYDEVINPGVFGDPTR
jgi:hypothetical protein